MPTYEYRCEKCGKRFTQVLTISEHDTKKTKCPKCGSAKVRQLFSAFFAKTESKT
ncbi:MAG TPA: zinc ribbon domain-containing protein [Thermodesulfobacteriota bacterium]|nr:zinc ribbon domain-containing protein [Thermodesulfobacteriota bacterium]